MSDLVRKLPGNGSGAYTDPARWPRKHGESGVVPYWTVVPDPRQPRKYFGERALRELAESIKQHGQAEIATVVVLSDEERKNFIRPDGKEPFYMLVSGERRWRATGLAGLDFFEIRIRAYKNERERFLDAFLLNETRENLEPPDAALSLLRILTDICNGNVAELCRITGRSRGYVEGYLVLNQLAPDVLELMNPDRPEEKTLKLGTAQALALLPFARQRSYAKRILEKGEGGRGAVNQKRWIEAQNLIDGGSSPDPSKQESPSRRDTLRTIFRYIDSQSMRLQALSNLSDSDLEKAFRGVSGEQISDFIRSFNALLAGNGRFRDRVMKLRERKQSTAERLVANPALVGYRIADYYDQGKVLVKDSAVSPALYDNLKQKGWLAWQIEGTPDPLVGKGNNGAHVDSPQEDRSTVVPTQSASSEMIEVSFYESLPGRTPRLIESRMVGSETYASLRRAGSLFWQKMRLPEPASEEEYRSSLKLKL